MEIHVAMVQEDKLVAKEMVSMVYTIYGLLNGIILAALLCWHALVPIFKRNSSQEALDLCAWSGMEATGALPCTAPEQHCWQHQPSFAA